MSSDASSGYSDILEDREVVRLGNHHLARLEAAVDDGVYVSNSEAIRTGLRELLYCSTSPPPKGEPLPSETGSSRRLTVRLPRDLQTELDDQVDEWESTSELLRAAVRIGLDNYGRWSR